MQQIPYGTASSPRLPLSACYSMLSLYDLELMELVLCVVESFRTQKQPTSHLWFNNVLAAVWRPRTILTGL